MPTPCLFVTRVVYLVFSTLPDKSNPYLQSSLCPEFPSTSEGVLVAQDLIQWRICNRIVLPLFPQLHAHIFFVLDVITKSVVALGNQGMLCWMCICEQLNERDSWIWSLCQSYGPSGGVGLIGCDCVSVLGCWSAWLIILASCSFLW